MKSKRKALIITLGLIWSFLLVFVPITGYFTGLQADKKSESGGANFNPNNKTQIESFNGLFIIGEVTSIDPLSFSYRMSLFITPVGSFSKDQKLAQPIVFFVNGKPTPFEGNQYTSNRDVIVTFSTGDSNHYPFDVYTDTIHVHAQTGNASDPQPVPIAIVVGGNVQGWNQLPIIESTETGTSIFLTISRTETVKFFSIFIVILMWVLSLTAISLAVVLTIYVKEKKIEAPTIAVFGALLFALPALRNTQPGVPPIGCFNDAIGFFWNMALIGICVIMLMTCYSFHYVWSSDKAEVGSKMKTATAPTATDVEAVK